MAHLINEGHPGGEASATAWKTNAHYWDMEDRTVAAETATSRAALRDAEGSPSPPRRQGGEKRKEAPRNLMGVRQAAVDSKKRKICGTFISKRGCTAPCSKGLRHVCNVVAPDGKACEGRMGQPNHSAFHCPHASR